MTRRQELGEQYLERFSGSPTKAIARIIAKEHPVEFTVESARSLLRRLRGNFGKRDKKQLENQNRTKYFRPNQSPGYYFGQIPEGINQYETKWDVVKINISKAIALYDVHIPFHDKEALEIALRYGLDNGCKDVIIPGDFADFFSVSDFRRDVTLVQFREEIEIVKRNLEIIRNLFPGNIYFKEGNHEERLESYLMARAPELLGIKDFYLKNVFGLKDLGIEYIGDKRPLKIDHLNIIHGHEFTYSSYNPVNPARGYFLKSKAICLGGHYHQTSEHTEMSLDGKLISVWSSGCLCHSKDTEVLTEQGFKSIPKVSKKDKIAEYDKETGLINYANPIQKQQFHYDGKMYLLKSKRLNQLVTPNHKMLIYRPDSNWQMKDENAKDLFDRKGLISLIVAGKFKGINQLYFGDIRDILLSELIGFIITDGYYRKTSRGIRLYQKNYFERVKFLLDRLKIPYSLGMSRTIPVFNIPAVWGKELRKLNPIKNQISRVLLDCSTNVLIGLYRGLISGDGWRTYPKIQQHKSTDYFSTHHKETVDQFQELCCKIGYSCRIKKELKEKTNLCNRKSYIYKCLVRKFKSSNIKEKSIVHYNDMVYDLTTNTGYFIVRRNGLVSVSGNCDLHPKFAPINKWNHGFAIVDMTSKKFKVDNLRIIKGEVV